VVHEACWKDEAPYLVFDIAAQAFLYHMVRLIVNIQVSIAQGRLSIVDLEVALRTGTDPNLGAAPLEKFSQDKVHGLAPAQGLILVEVHYKPECLKLCEDNQK
jgi:tRNA pseudouridine38-40 synthase